MYTLGMFRPLPSQERLQELLDYEPATGRLVWKRRAAPTRHLKIWNTRYAGKPASTDHGRYSAIGVDGTVYFASRIIWKWMTGEDPTHEIDHANADRYDNAWQNLRLATHAQNTHNTANRNRHVGLKGVAFHAGNPSRPFQARISTNGRRISLGYFKTPEEAHAAYCEAVREHYGEFARHR